jgi:serine/threonine-protein kinase
LWWVDRQGREEPVKGPPRAYVDPRLSPDGTKVALGVRDQESDIWIWDFARATLTRLTFDPTGDVLPVWTSDGKRIVFASARERSVNNLFWQSADGTGAVERLTESPNNQVPSNFSPDGKRLVLAEIVNGSDLMALSFDGERRTQPLVRTQFSERNAEISPDGRWIAYESDESGQFEIYVRPFPNVDEGRWQISTGGGAKPLWARSGRELFHLAPVTRLMVVPVKSGPTFAAGNPELLFEGRYLDAAFIGRTYDVSPDGKRFLMIK